MTEKGSLLPPTPGAQRQLPSTPRYSGYLVRPIAVLIILNLALFAYQFADGIFRPLPSESGSPAGRVSREKCPQVAPLAPTLSSTDALDRMDKFIASDDFRNGTVPRMSGAIKIPSMSYDDLGPVGEDPRWDVMYDFSAYLKDTFPLVHKELGLDKVNTHGLLYTWQGSDAELKPTVLMAHQDVVPVAKSTVDQWTHPPFSGEYDGDFIWGRGAADCKNSLIGILEAIELLIDAGFKPKRTLVLSFGFDEEISGRQGARYLSKAILERYGANGVASVVDEGAGMYSAWGTTFALPGVAEKGYMDVEISVRMPGGHSSVPPAHTGIGILAELITHIEANPYEPRLNAENPFLGMLTCAANHAPEFPNGLQKLLDWHRRHGGGGKDKLALAVAEQGPQVKYLFTTSAAVDTITGGVKVNALPEHAVALVNHRINVGERSSDVRDKLTRLADKVARKHNLTLNAFPNQDDEAAMALADAERSITLSIEKVILEPAPVTPTDIIAGDGRATAYAVLAGTTRELYGEDMVVAPGIMTGNTDTRYYWGVSDNIFRFAPGWDPDFDMWEGIHTVDERVSVRAHVRTVQWYSRFIRNMDEADLD